MEEEEEEKLINVNIVIIKFINLVLLNESKKKIYINTKYEFDSYEKCKCEFKYSIQ